MLSTKKCARVKNPCKICLQSVTNKTGLQCQGACKKWAHFTCLNYTPGKIQDIKKGLIKVTCPCPNCSTQTPKEVLTKPPYNCEKDKCPANLNPECEKEECPIKKLVSITADYEKCGPACRAKTKPVKPSQQVPLTTSDDAAPPCMSQPLTSPEILKGGVKERIRSKTCQDSITSQTDTAECRLRGKSCSCSCLSDILDGKDMVDNERQRVDSADELNETQKVGDFKTSSSDSKLFFPSNLNYSKEDHKNLLCTIQELCGTMGELSTRIKDLMCKMLISLEK